MAAMASQLTHVALTPLDHLHRPNYIKISYWIPLNEHAKPREVYNFLGAGLRSMFHKMPWLGGKVHLQEPGTPGWRPGQRELRYAPWDAEGGVPHQLVFKELNGELSYADLKDEGFPSDAFADEELLDVPVEGNMEVGCDVWAAQTSFIAGGLILTMSTCHAAVDGTGMVMVMKAWADSCRGVSDDEAFPPETYDRSLLDKLWEKEGGHVPTDADEWTRGLVGLVEQGDDGDSGMGGMATGTPTPTASMGKAVHKTFYLPASALAILQKQCDESAQRGGPAFSISDIITALMWRGAVRARTMVAGAQLADDSVLEGAVNGRLDFSQSLHPAYLGNTTFYNQAKLPFHSVIDPEVPLSTLAEAVRTGAARINSKSLNYAYGLLRSIPDYNEIQPLFRRPSGADMLISNLLVFPVDDISFGNALFGNAGKAEALRCYLGQFNDYCRCSLVLPRRPGGVEIEMNLKEQEMLALETDKEWNKYCLVL